ncbi:LamG domain-containing protein [Actinoplanes sp. NPDC049668]|uniref:LamG domain-containing protein n=1 Tax=unclassified Actinoplanes TaxID=2626549 RepID=UPI0033A93054
MDPWLDAGIPVVVGGDLNRSPFGTVLNGFYGMDNGTGRFTEVDEADGQYFQAAVDTVGGCEQAAPADRANCVPCPSSATRCRSGEPTFDVWNQAEPQLHRKLDYIFLSREHFTDVVGDAVQEAPYADPTITDHSALRGAARWRTSAPNLGHWTFDEASGTAADVTGVGQPATLSGTTARGAGINGGRALQLTGTGFAKTTGPVLRTDQSFTVDAWVKLANKNNYQTAVTQDGAGIGAFYLQYNKGSDRWVFNVPDQDSTDTTNWEHARSTGSPVIGEWTRLTGVYDAAAHQTRLYVNGVPHGTADGVTLWHGNGPLRIGASRWGTDTTDQWSGAIDEVRVWQYARTDTEIRNAPTGQWNFAETAGDAQDRSGNGRPAVMSGTTARGVGINGGRALQLDGAGVAKTAGPVLRTDQSFTVDAWVKLANKNNYQVAVSQDGAGIGAFYLQYNKGSDRWVFNVPTSDSTGPNNWEHARSTGSPVIGEWTRLTGVYDAAAHQTRLYVNGELQGTADGVTLWHGNGPLRIGGAHWGGSTTDQWSGAIDEVRVWQYARTDTEIAADPSRQY